jgi:uncharacterized protein
MSALKLIVLPGHYSLCRLKPSDTVPDWVATSSFYSISKSPEELSIVCETAFVPDSVKKSDGWRLLKIDAILDLSLTGITAKFSTALTGAGVNLCVIATYDTDYIMVKEEKLTTAITALAKADFIVE